MENLFLTKQQQREIAYEIYEGLDFCSHAVPKVDFDYFIGDVIVNIKAHAEAEGYTEDDYFNGTGAWVVTYACCTIDEISASNETEDLFVVYDAPFIEHIVELEIKH